MGHQLIRVQGKKAVPNSRKNIYTHRQTLRDQTTDETTKYYFFTSSNLSLPEKSVQKKKN